MDRGSYDGSSRVPRNSRNPFFPTGSYQSQNSRMSVSRGPDGEHVEYEEFDHRELYYEDFRMSVPRNPQASFLHGSMRSNIPPNTLSRAEERPHAERQHTLQNMMQQQEEHRHREEIRRAGVNRIHQAMALGPEEREQHRAAHAHRSFEMGRKLAEQQYRPRNGGGTSVGDASLQALRAEQRRVGMLDDDEPAMARGPLFDRGQQPGRMVLNPPPRGERQIRNALDEHNQGRGLSLGDPSLQALRAEQRRVGMLDDDEPAMVRSPLFDRGQQPGWGVFENPLPRGEQQRRNAVHEHDQRRGLSLGDASLQALRAEQRRVGMLDEDEPAVARGPLFGRSVLPHPPRRVQRQNAMHEEDQGHGLSVADSSHQALRAAQQRSGLIDKNGPDIDGRLPPRAQLDEERAGVAPASNHGAPPVLPQRRLPVFVTAGNDYGSTQEPHDRQRELNLRDDNGPVMARDSHDLAEVYNRRRTHGDRASAPDRPIRTDKQKPLTEPCYTRHDPFPNHEEAVFCNECGQKIHEECFEN